MAFLLPVVNAAGKKPAVPHGNGGSIYSLHSPSLLTRQHEHIKLVQEDLNAVLIPAITAASFNHCLRTLTADNSSNGAFHKIHCSFAGIPSVETFSNNQRCYNHPTHQFW